MKRTVNNTGRKRIEFENFDVDVYSNVGSVGYSARVTWRLSHLALRSTANVVLSVSGRGLDKRFDLGEVGTGDDTGVVEISETEENPALRVQLTVSEWSDDRTIRKIVAASASRAIVMGDIPSNSQSILPVKLVSDLMTLWSLDYSTGTPILLVSNKLPGVVSQPWFKLAVLPQVVKSIFKKLAFDSENLDADVLQIWEDYFGELGFDLEAFRSEIDFDGLSVSDFTEAEDAADDVAVMLTEKNGLLNPVVVEMQDAE